MNELSNWLYQRKKRLEKEEMERKKLQCKEDGHDWNSTRCTCKKCGFSCHIWEYISVYREASSHEEDVYDGYQGTAGSTRTVYHDDAGYEQYRRCKKCGYTEKEWGPNSWSYSHMLGKDILPSIFEVERNVELEKKHQRERKLVGIRNMSVFILQASISVFFIGWIFNLWNLSFSKQLYQEYFEFHFISFRFIEIVPLCLVCIIIVLLSSVLRRKSGLRFQPIILMIYIYIMYAVAVTNNAYENISALSFVVGTVAMVLIIGAVVGIISYAFDRFASYFGCFAWLLLIAAIVALIVISVFELNGSNLTNGLTYYFTFLAFCLLPVVPSVIIVSIVEF